MVILYRSSFVYQPDGSGAKTGAKAKIETSTYIEVLVKVGVGVYQTADIGKRVILLLVRAFRVFLAL